MGIGSAVGLLAASALATRVTVSPSRVLLIDIGVGGGALLGAAATSPLLFQNIENPTQSGTPGFGQYTPPRRTPPSQLSLAATVTRWRRASLRKKKREAFRRPAANNIGDPPGS
jgi:hypothetical protein